MRILVQKALDASVTVENEVIGKIPHGYVLLVGISKEDTAEDVEFLAKKVANLRIYPDEQDKMNKTITDCGGEILSISQFTLYGDLSDGNRPSFTSAAPKEIAEPLFDRFNELLSEKYHLRVETGRFGAHMLLRFTNDGPNTLLLESKKKNTR